MAERLTACFGIDIDAISMEDMNMHSNAVIEFGYFVKRAIPMMKQLKK